MDSRITGRSFQYPLEGYASQGPPFSLFPRQHALRIAAAIWLAVAAILLAAMMLRPEWMTGERKALSTLVPLYFMSFPLGHVGLLAVNKMTLALYLSNEFVPAIHVEGVWLWTLLTVLGYAQWFVLPSLVSSRIRRLGRAYRTGRAHAR